MMRTLDRWVERFSMTPRQIQCREMTIQAFYDWEPPIFTGNGTVYLDTPTYFRFIMHARPSDAGDAFRRLGELDRSPYQIQNAFKLLATDYDGTEWNCGWTSPRVASLSESGREMLLEGTVARLSTASQGDTVAEEAGVELVFSPSPRLPLSERLLTTVTMGDTDIAWRAVGGRHACDVLGSKVEVSRDPWSENLWLMATTSKNLPHPFLENWVSEPLRVLCGQLVYPRFVARNFGCGRAFVDIRPSPSWRSRLGGCVVFLGRTVDAFWGFYERYLAYLSRFRGPNGQPVLESNSLTRLYEEVIQAANGSKWMFELALTSAIEGACRLAVAPQTLPTDFDPKEIDSVRELINSWPEHKAVGSRLLKYLDFMKQPSAGAHLRGLVESSVIRKAHRDAWMEVRHPVAHGELGDPRPSEASEEQLNLLLELLYILTIRIIEANPEATPRTE